MGKIASCFYFLVGWLLTQHPKQTTFIYCECGEELINSDSFISDTYEKDQNIVHYECKNCGKNSYWDFDHILPLLIKTKK